MSALLYSTSPCAAEDAAASRRRVLPAKAAAPPAAVVATTPRKLLRVLRLAVAVLVVAAHAAPLTLGLPLAAVPLVVGSLGLAAMLLSRWSH
jgi:hypothetical protein